MTDRTPTLARLAAHVAPAAIDLRRNIHRHPEIGWQERRTTALVASTLEAHGLKPRVRAEGVGLHVDVGEGPAAVGFRADLDALELTEETGAGYSSTVPGVMHACGHDVHTAIGVGIARALSDLGDLPGRVRVIFQPAEEQIPGGAVVLCEEGVHLGLSSILAFHVDPSLQVGQIGIREGGITGASDRLIIRLSGPGGHTSRPHQTVDLAYVAARIITNLPVLIRYGIDPRETALIVFGRVNGGSTENVIPTHMELGGTVRLFDLELWRNMPKMIEGLVRDLVTPLGAVAEIDYRRGSPPVINDPDVIRMVRAAGAAYLGAAGVADTHQSLGSEDFAWYLEDVPGALVRLGVRGGDTARDLHSASFDVDESAIEVGIGVGAEILLDLLERAAGEPSLDQQ